MHLQPPIPQVELGTMLFLLDSAVSDCVKVAQSCKRPQAARLLRQLAADITGERDRVYDLLITQQPHWNHGTFANVPRLYLEPATPGVAASPANRRRRARLMHRVIERFRVIGASDMLPTAATRLPASG
jgi:hypothetical protein